MEISSTAYGDGLDLRATVAKLNRNVVIKGSDEGDWGVHILIYNWLATTTNGTTVTLNGLLNLNNVEVQNGGERDTIYAALDFVRAT